MCLGSQAWPQSACAFGWSGLPEYPVPPLKLVCEDWPALSGKLLLCQFIFKQEQVWEGWTVTFSRKAPKPVAAKQVAGAFSTPSTSLHLGSPPSLTELPSGDRICVCLHSPVLQLPPPPPALPPVLLSFGGSSISTVAFVPFWYPWAF